MSVGWKAPSFPRITRRHLQYSRPRRAGEALVAGFHYPGLLLQPAQRELDGFIALLRSLGVVARRPDATDYRQRFGAPGWSSRGFCNACPRDSMLVIGDEIIETPMAWPCRYFETYSYRALLKEYFRGGARWTAAPRPQLIDELFDPIYHVPEQGEPISYILTEFEPVFDAADFFRCGRDIFAIRSNVTNAFGIDWLRRFSATTIASTRSKAAVAPRCISTPRCCRSALARC